jgi:hypothetical protein
VSLGKVETGSVCSLRRRDASLLLLLMRKLLWLALLSAVQAAVPECVPGTTDVRQIRNTNDAAALAKAIICPNVTVRAVVSGTVQPTDTITVGTKSKLVISALTAVKPAAIDGQGTVQLFSVLAGGELSSQNVVLSNGFAVAGGGGILAAANTTIALVGATLQGHTATAGAAIFSNGTVSIDQVHQHLL